MRTPNLTGKVIGRITVIKRVENDKHGKARWLCRCECGNVWTVTTGDLRKIRQCMECGKNVSGTIKHGACKTRLYKIYRGMINRCNNPNNYGYKNYGARGISVCEEWEEFENFRKWALDNGYDDNDTSIERIDVNGNYEPQNCKWIKRKDQIHNRRNSIRFKVDGRMMDLAEISRKYNIKYMTLHDRIFRGWSIERAIAEEVQKND